MKIFFIYFIFFFGGGGGWGVFSEKRTISRLQLVFVMLQFQIIISMPDIPDLFLLSGGVNCYSKCWGKKHEGIFHLHNGSCV